MREISKRSSLRYNFLTNRVVSKWNVLPHSVVNAKTVNGFKAGIDREVFGMGQRNRRKTATAPIELNAERR